MSAAAVAPPRKPVAPVIRIFIEQHLLFLLMDHGRACRLQPGPDMRPGPLRTTRHRDSRDGANRSQAKY